MSSKGADDPKPPMTVPKDRGKGVRSDFWKLRCPHREPHRGIPLSCQAGVGASPFPKHTQKVCVGGVGGTCTVVCFTVTTELREGDPSHQGTQLLNAKLSFTPKGVSTLKGAHHLNYSVPSFLPP